MKDESKVGRGNIVREDLFHDRNLTLSGPKLRIEVANGPVEWVVKNKVIGSIILLLSCKTKCLSNVPY